MSAKYVWLCRACAEFYFDGEVEEFQNLDPSVALPACHCCTRKKRRSEMHFVRYERKFEDARDTGRPGGKPS